MGWSRVSASLRGSDWPWLPPTSNAQFLALVLKLLKMATGMRALLDTVVQALPQVGGQLLQGLLELKETHCPIYAVSSPANMPAQPCVHLSMVLTLSTIHPSTTPPVCLFIHYTALLASPCHPSHPHPAHSSVHQHLTPPSTEPMSLSIHTPTSVRSRL